MHLAQGRATSILVVDDEKGVRGSISLILSEEGFDVTEAQNFDEAIIHLEKSRFDLVISDVNMPEKTGLDLLLVVS